LSNISKFIIWIFKKFTRDEILKIIEKLVEAIDNDDPDLQPRDKFKEKHPNYRNFLVDPLTPLTKAPERTEGHLDFKILLAEYEYLYGKALKPVNARKDDNTVSKDLICPFCNAPHIYLYCNNGKKKSQMKCKVCLHTSHLKGKHKRKCNFFCPYCSHALFTWKRKESVTIYKCDNNNCPYRLKRLKKLNKKEKKLRKQKLSQFKINYQFRQYHFKPNKLRVIGPHKPKVDLIKIHNDINTFALVLTLHISYAITARKTAHMLRNIFNISISYQTVLNYTEAAAYYCHQFNKNNKSIIDDILAGDETYIKILGVHHYTWFFICAKSRIISAYHISNSRDTQHAVKTMLEVIRNVENDKNITFVTDGNPSYQAGLHYINMNNKHLKIALKNVIGLQNLDAESEEYRPYKQIIERLNRTYKYHIQPANGFNSFNGAVSKTVLFVTYYNFIRPHKSLKYQSPIKLSQLNGIDTIQGKWAKVISLAA